MQAWRGRELGARRIVLTRLIWACPEDRLSTVERALLAPGMQEAAEEAQGGAEKLPLELLANIFAFLNAPDVLLAVPRVCRSWYCASKDPRALACLVYDGALARLRVGAARLAWLARELWPLEVLDLSDSAFATDEAVSIAFECCTGLQRLRLRNCAQLSPASLAALAASRSARTLRELDLSRCPWVDDSALALCRPLCALRTLRFAGCDEVSDEAFCAFISVVGDGLRELCVAECEQLGDEALLAVARHCTRLEQLDLSGLAVSEEAVGRAIASVGATIETICLAGLRSLSGGRFLDVPLPRLGVLDLRHCVGLRDAALHALGAGGAPKLRSVALDWCALLTDSSLASLAKGCSRLEVLGLVRCGRITDAGLRALASGCGQLRALDLSHCLRVTDSGLRFLASGCTRLERLALGGCHALSDSATQCLPLSCAVHPQPTAPP
jgi:hypothetical protein